jgi:hypothetical protein
VRKYLFQKFLPNCNTDDINLEDCTYIGETNIQKILISELDEKIDTEENLVSLLKSFSSDDIIVLTYDRPAYNNPILCDYANKTLKSYLYWVRLFGYNCYWEQSQTA